jgi:CheY-like chemotaxis protein
VTTTLLAVDDSKTMRKVLEITFAGEDYRTVLAESSADALQKLGAEGPAVVLIDAQLGSENGYDLCQQVKQNAPGAQVLILSSKQQPYDRSRGSAVGADDFMDKPFDTQQLIDKVGALARKAGEAGAQPAAAAAPPAAAPAPSPAPAPVAAAPGAPPGLRPRSPTLSYGAPPPGAAPAPAAAAAPPRAQTATGTPAPPQAQPAPAPVRQTAPIAPTPVTGVPVPAKPAAVAAPAAAAAATNGSGQFAEKLEGLGLDSDQVQAVLALSREVVEQVVWEVVPVLAETLIKEEIRRLTNE